MRLNDTFAPCKSITLQCTCLKLKRTFLISCLLTSVLSSGATTESSIKYPKLLETGTCLMIVLSPLTPIEL